MNTLRQLAELFWPSNRGHRFRARRLYRLFAVLVAGIVAVDPSWWAAPDHSLALGFGVLLVIVGDISLRQRQSSQDDPRPSLLPSFGLMLWGGGFITQSLPMPGGGRDWMDTLSLLLLAVALSVFVVATIQERRRKTR